MCLYVKEGCKPEIATKDIVCYKVVKDCGKYWKPYIISEKYSYPYNKILTAGYDNISKIYLIQHLRVCRTYLYSAIRKKAIYEGFHARCNKTHGYTNICVIPKGTEYCLGERNDIVAVNMIVFRSMLCYYWYRIKKHIKYKT